MAHTKPKWKRINLAKNEQEKELQAAKFYLNLQNTSLNDRSFKETMRCAKNKYFTNAEHRIRAKAKRIKHGIISNDPKIQDRIRVTRLPSDIIKDLEVFSMEMTSKVNKKTQTDFRRIVNTNLKQWIIKQDFYRLFGETKFNDQSIAFKNNLEQFVTGNALMGMGFLFDEIDMS